MITEIEMEDRQCVSANCKMQFRVSVGSNQLYHSSYCADNDPNRERNEKEWQRTMRKINTGHVKLNQQQRMEKKGPSPVMKSEKLISVGSGRTTQPIEKKKIEREESLPPIIEKKKERVLETITPTIKKKIMPEEQKIEEKILNTTDNTIETIMPETNLNSSKESNSGDTPMILPADFIQPSQTLKTVVLDSMSLIDDSMKLMHDSAQSLVKDSTEGGKVTSDDYKIKTAIQCVAEVRNLMKTKIEIARLVLDIPGKKK